MSFHDKVAIVTGGAQGIGSGIAIHFLQQGATVVVVDHDAAAGKEFVKECQLVGDIHFIHADVGSEADVTAAVASVIKKFKRLDFLINNAGVSIFKPMHALTLKEWNHIINTNLTSVFLFAKTCRPYLKKTHGVIVNIASTRALMSDPDTEAYSATKGGIVALTHALAISLGPEIRVNCISPGWIEVGNAKKASARKRVHHSKADNQQHPVGRVGEPADIATMAAYLVSPEASFITGQNFIVDGGMTRKMIYV